MLRKHFKQAVEPVEVVGLSDLLHVLGEGLGQAGPPKSSEEEHYRLQRPIAFSIFERAFAKEKTGKPCCLIFIVRLPFPPVGGSRPLLLPLVLANTTNGGCQRQIIVSREVIRLRSVDDGSRQFQCLRPLPRFHHAGQEIRCIRQIVITPNFCMICTRPEHQSRLLVPAGHCTTFVA